MNEYILTDADANNHCIARLITHEEMLERSVKSMEKHLKDNDIIYQCPLCKSSEYSINISYTLGSQLVCKKCKHITHFNITFR